MTRPSALSDADLLAALVDHYCDYRRMHRELLAAVEAEEARGGVTDPQHYAYPTFCVAGRKRLTSLDEASEKVAERIRGLDGEVPAREDDQTDDQLLDGAMTYLRERYGSDQFPAGICPGQYGVAVGNAFLTIIAEGDAEVRFVVSRKADGVFDLGGKVQTRKVLA